MKQSSVLDKGFEGGFLGEGLFEGHKPRLGYIRALMSEEGFDLTTVVVAYNYWVNFIEYMIFMGIKKGSWETRFKAVKCSKRGNDVYNWRISKRFRELNALKEVVFFNPRGNVKKTRGLFVTLTFDPKALRLDQLWEHVGVAFNKWITRLRSRYGKIQVLRVWEAHKSGYPHIHCLLFFEESEFEVFRYTGVWRIEEKAFFEWEYGFVDVEALRSFKEGVNYVTKYLGKLHQWGVTSDIGEEVTLEQGDPSLRSLPWRASRLTLSLLWVFRKRCFSLSRSLVDLIATMHNSNSQLGLKVQQVDFEGRKIWIWVRLGSYSGSLGGDPPPWSKDLTLAEVRELEDSTEWTPNWSLILGKYRKKSDIDPYNWVGYGGSFE
jgi:hypothetical protein